jgi:FlaA1/EpsC-like NDP-sugar epimerase
VTGAGGSIGSEIVTLLHSIPNLRYLATDHDETSLHTLSLRLSKRALFDSDDFQLMDIRDRQGVTSTIETFEPTAIIHAAALKHLSVLERQPREAVLTNIIGTWNVLQSASKAKVNSLVNISTDKAANPKSVLGKSKKVAELLTAYFRRVGNPGFTSCRFGNVFSSRGSVIETFAAQIRTGSPITLTDANVERFFMHPSEAALLTVHSLLINKGNVHFFDMGDPIKLIDIIASMQNIAASNNPLIITGLRKGEKLTEELFDPFCSSQETINKKIRVTNLQFDNLELQALIKQIEENDIPALVEGIMRK